VVIVHEFALSGTGFSREEWKPDQVMNRLDSVSVGFWSEAFRLAVQVDAFQTGAVFLCFNVGHGDWPCSFDRFHLRSAKFFWSCHCFAYWICCAYSVRRIFGLFLCIVILMNQRYTGPEAFPTGIVRPVVFPGQVVRFGLKPGGWSLLSFSSRFYRSVLIRIAGDRLTCVRFTVQRDAFENNAWFFCDVRQWNGACSFNRFHLFWAERFFCACHDWNVLEIMPTLLSGFSAASCLTFKLYSKYTSSICPRPCRLCRRLISGINGREHRIAGEVWYHTNCFLQKK